MIYKYIFEGCFYSFILLFLTGCINDPNEEANKLYVSAMKSTEILMGDTKKSSTELFEYYNSARSDIETILNNYPSSNLAVSILSGKTQLSNYTLREFRAVEQSFERLFQAEKDPFICAVEMSIKSNTEGSDRKLSSLLIPKLYLKRGRKEQAIKYLSEALKTANNLKYKEERAEALASIAILYKEAGEDEKAMRINNKVLGIVKMSSYYVGSVIGRYVEAGNLSQALEVENNDRVNHRYYPEFKKYFDNQLKVPGKEKAVELYAQVLDALKYPRQQYFDQSEYLTKIINRLILVGEVDKAKHLVLQSYKLIVKHDVGFSEEVIALFDSVGYLDKLLKLARRTKGSFQLLDLAHFHIQEGRKWEGMQLLKEAESLHAGKIWLLVRVADEYVEAGKKDEAFRLLSQALKSLQSYKDNEKKAEDFIDIANRYIKYGEPAKGLELLSKAKLLQQDNLSKTSKILINIAKAYSQSEKKDQSVIFLNEALGAAKSIKDKEINSTRLKEIVLMCAELGVNPSKHFDIFSVIELINVKKKSQQFDLLLSIAEKYLKAEENDMALEFYSRALETVKTIKDEFRKADLLTKLVADYPSAGLFFTQAVLEEVKTLKEKERQVFTLMELAEIYTFLGKKEKAEKVQLAALELAISIEDKTERGGILIYTAMSYQKLKKYKEVEKVLQIAQESIKEIKRKSVRDKELLVLTDMYIESGLYTQALELVKSIKDKSLKVVILLKVADALDKQSETLGKADLLILHDIVAEENLKEGIFKPILKES